MNGCQRHGEERGIFYIVEAHYPHVAGYSNTDLFKDFRIASAGHNHTNLRDSGMRFLDALFLELTCVLESTPRSRRPCSRKAQPTLGRDTPERFAICVRWQANHRAKFPDDDLSSHLAGNCLAVCQTFYGKSCQ